MFAQPNKVFLFDAGNVLIDFDLPALFQRIADDSGRSLDEVAITPEDAHHLRAVERGDIEDDEFLAHLNRAKGLTWTIEDLVGAWQDVYSLNEAGLELFRALRRDRHNACILSNIAYHNVLAI